MMYRFLAAAILLCFYGTYLRKMLCQRRRGIQTDQMAKGDKPSSVRRTELVMKVATFLLAAVQAVSVLCGWSMMPAPARAAGAVLGLVGDGIFLAAVYTMRDSWRAVSPRAKTLSWCTAASTATAATRLSWDLT